MSHSVLYVYVSEDRKIGIHGYTHGTMTSARFAKAPYLITPIGYKPKLDGNQLKDHDYNPKYGGVDAKGPIIKPEDSGLTFIDAWSDTGRCSSYGYTARRSIQCRCCLPPYRRGLSSAFRRFPWSLTVRHSYRCTPSSRCKRHSSGHC